MSAHTEFSYFSELCL